MFSLITGGPRRSCNTCGERCRSSLLSAPPKLSGCYGVLFLVQRKACSNFLGATGYFSWLLRGTFFGPAQGLPKFSGCYGVLFLVRPCPCVSRRGTLSHSFPRAPNDFVTVLASICISPSFACTLSRFTSASRCWEKNHFCMPLHCGFALHASRWRPENE